MPPRVAREIAGSDKVETDFPPVMGAEDFAFMLDERPGAFIFVGNGDSAGLHHPAYNFNDEAIPVGTSYWVRLAETALAARSCSLAAAYCAASTRFSAGSFGGSAMAASAAATTRRLGVDAAPVGERVEAACPR